MAVGRPCIGISFGGQAKFLNKHVGYPVEYKLVPAEFNYRGGGVWAEPNEDHVISLMRRVYEDRAECRMLGRAAAAAMRPMTWQRSNAALLDVLREFNAVS